MRNAIFWPLIAQVVIVALVAGRLYVMRVYIASTLCVLAMWGLFAISLWQNG